MQSPNHSRLLARLDSATTSSSGDRTPILLCAPAGYGKTKLISAWLDQVNPERIVRMRCLPDTAAELWHDIASTLSNALGLAPQAVGAPRAALLRALAAVADPVTFVIDDYHFATTPENDLALLDLIGPQLRLVIIARRVALLDGPLAARRVPMLALSAQLLAFSPDEARAHARQQFDAPDSGATDTALVLAGGWPLAVRAAFMPVAAQSGTSAAEVGSNSGDQFNPLAALRRFAHYQLEGLARLGQTILLASTVVDVIDSEQARLIAADEGAIDEASCASAGDAIHELIELGLLMPAPSGDTAEFVCHPAIRFGIESRVATALTDAQLRELARNRAAKIAATAPLTAFAMYLNVESYAEAELVLAQHFTTITDEHQSAERMLRALSTEVLQQHPVFIAARLFFDLSNPGRPGSALKFLARLWIESIEHLSERPDRSPELLLPDMMQQMVATRLSGDVFAANRLSHEIEARMDATNVFTSSRELECYGARRVLGSGSLPIYYRELATTAVLAGELERGRRIWERLRSHAEHLIVYPWPGFPPSSSRTVTDVESGRGWLLVAIFELAFTEVLGGDVKRARELLETADELARSIGSRGPGTSWINGELARAHLSYEIGDVSLLEQATVSIAPYADRLEQWPWLLMAETSFKLSTCGIAWALPQFESGLQRLQRANGSGAPVKRLLSGYHAVLATIAGRFTDADRIIASLPADSPGTFIERARRALFSGDDAAAMLTARKVTDIAISQRLQMHRCLIVTCAAWGLGRTEDAFEALQRAAGLIDRTGVFSVLHAVPYATLRDVAVAARDAGLIDMTHLVESIPEPARARRFDPLTEMELRTLKTVAAHGSTNAAAEVMFVTPGTVKKHLNAVYRKLAVKGREEAILQADQMGLLSN